MEFRYPGIDNLLQRVSNDFRWEECRTSTKLLDPLTYNVIAQFNELDIEMTGRAEERQIHVHLSFDQMNELIAGCYVSRILTALLSADRILRLGV